ncbi:DinB family protein [Nonomuraea longicatena]|uniref:Mini-circle protein n=1 Tax=Nonomuraea longicatena TaxID=83682 RepID=A0ABP3Z5M9_9ACTN
MSIGELWCPGSGHVPLVEVFFADGPDAACRVLPGPVQIDSVRSLCGAVYAIDGAGLRVGRVRAHRAKAIPSLAWPIIGAVRIEPRGTAGERESLEAFLDYHRETLVEKCEGLSDEELRRRAAPPSSMSLLGLVRHLSEVERGWFRIRVGGERDLPFVYCSEAEPDADFDRVEGDDRAGAFAVWRAEVAAAKKAAAGVSLEAVFERKREPRQVSLRWIYLHLIEEYARHNGHADLLRERIDGATGE